ncbi:MAG: PilN domain-containing protein [Burkholderiaceae bacterium]|nr:PilN domain-containing protein [Burkholderiaceae bacterium]
MSSTSPSPRAYQVDLRVLWQGLRQSLKGLPDSACLSWLTPDLPVRVHHAHGTEAVWRGGRALGAFPKPVAFEALEIPDDLLLRRTLAMPDLAPAQIAEAVALEIHSASPFAPEDTVGGFASRAAPAGGLHIDIVLASRKQLSAYVEAQQARLKVPATAEVWAFSPAGAPVTLPGWGEARRTGQAVLRRRLGYGLLASALALACAIAITPTAQLRLRAIEAVYAYDDVFARTKPLVGQREVFVRTVEELDTVRGLLTERADPLKVLELLTRVLPDDTSLQTLQLQGLKVTLLGLTANAAALMQLLGSQEGIKDVKAPSAATRNPGATAEVFNIEFQLDPAVYGLAVVPAPAPDPAAPAEPAPARPQ